jgi:hypothetical protein
MLEVIVEGKPTRRQQQDEKYDWNRADMKRMRMEMDKIIWRRELDSRTVQESWTRFREILTGITENTVLKRKQQWRAKQPWMTNEIKRQIRKKRRSWKTLKIHNTAENRERYSKVEKETKNMIRNAKRRLEKNLASGPNKKKQEICSLH